MDCVPDPEFFGMYQYCICPEPIIYNHHHEEHHDVEPYHHEEHHDVEPVYGRTCNPHDALSFCPNGEHCNPNHLDCVNYHYNGQVLVGRYLFCHCPHPDPHPALHTAPVHCDPYSHDPHQYCPNGAVCSAQHLDCVHDPTNPSRHLYCICPQGGPQIPIPPQTSTEVHCNPYPHSPNQICPDGSVCNLDTMDCVHDPTNPHRHLYCICPHHH